MNWREAKEAAAARYKKRNKLMVGSWGVYSSFELLRDKNPMVRNEQYSGTGFANNSISISWSWETWDGKDFCIHRYMDSNGFNDLFVFHNDKKVFEALEAQLIAVGLLDSKEDRAAKRALRASVRKTALDKKGITVGGYVMRDGVKMLVLEITKAGKLVLETSNEGQKYKVTAAPGSVKKA